MRRRDRLKCPDSGHPNLQCHVLIFGAPEDQDNDLTAASSFPDLQPIFSRIYAVAMNLDDNWSSIFVNIYSGKKNNIGIRLFIKEFTFTPKVYWRCDETVKQDHYFGLFMNNSFVSSKE